MHRARGRQGLVGWLLLAGRGGRGRAARPPGRRGRCFDFTGDREIASSRAAEMSSLWTRRLTARLSDPLRRLSVAARRLRLRAGAQAPDRCRRLAPSRDRAARGHAGARHGRPLALQDPRRVRGHRDRRRRPVRIPPDALAHGAADIHLPHPRRAHRAGGEGVRSSSIRAAYSWHPESPPDRRAGRARAAVAAALSRPRRRLAACGARGTSCSAAAGTGSP